MKWTQPPTPKPGQARTVRRFLWLPLTLQGETRWLERAEWVERRMQVHRYSAGKWWPVHLWQPVRWNDYFDDEGEA